MLLPVLRLARFESARASDADGTAAAGGGRILRRDVGVVVPL